MNQGDCVRALGIWKWMELRGKGKFPADTREKVGGMDTAGKINFHLPLSCESW